MDLPGHVVSRRRDGRREVLLHRSLAVISDTKVEIKASRGTVILPLIGLAICAGLGWWMIGTRGGVPVWSLALALLILLFLVPISMMSLVSSIAGADVVVDATKGSATWQQGYLGMGIGTRELVPFAKIDYLELVVEGGEPDRWRSQEDSLRQFGLWLIKKSGKRLRVAQVPVFRGDQADGADRTLAVANAVAALTGAEIRLPEGWEFVEIDTDTLQPVKPTPAVAADSDAGATQRGG